MDEIMSLAKDAWLAGTKKTDYRKLCFLLDDALNVKNIPNYKSFSDEQCREYAIGRFQGFLRYGVHNYVEGNPFREAREFFNKWMKDYGTYGIEKSHPLLQAYHKFARALDIGAIKKFDIKSLEACADEISFLFDEFLKQGTDAFARETYHPIKNDLGIFAYHTAGGPMRPEAQKAIHGIIEEAMQAHKERVEKLHRGIEETYRQNHPKSLVDKVKGLLTK